MDRAHLLLTETGGVQQDAPLLDKSVLLLRDRTEHGEVVDAGAVLLVGNERDRVVREVKRLLEEPGLHERMAHAENP
jgi:UDP-N-acetylglucosamine 2-epimerase (non-hydrolysing)